MDRNLDARARSYLGLALALCLHAPVALAETGEEAAVVDETKLEQLAKSSLEDLMQIQVTTVLGAPGSRMATPAAVHVISREDLRRSGFRTIAEALRMVPGWFVGRVNSSSWLAGSRGLTGSSLTATRYLVLIDGRQVYDPLLSTTFWDSVDLVLDDVDRIEVIRGPGATLWGTNAMNGVVNIVTRNTADTLGTLVQVGVGNSGRREVDLRHGASAGHDAHYRVWAKYAAFGDFEGPTGATLHDEWSTLRAGFRYDQALDPETTLTWQGDAYTHPEAMESVLLPVPGQDRQFVQATADNDINGGNLLFRVVRGFGTPEGWRLRAYYDRTERLTTRFGVERDTLDLDFRRWQAWGGRNDLIWGAEYLWTRDKVENGPVLQMNPESRAWYQFNAFVQNTTELSEERWFLMLGSKFTYHSFAGFEVQPNVRLWFTPSPDQTFWASVSRPVRMPSRFEENGILVFQYVDLGAISTGTPNGIILPIAITGDEDLQPEKLTAYELGHRIQFDGPWVIETSLFYNDYTRLIEPLPTIFGPFTDAGSGVTFGGEISVSGQVSTRWRLEGSYSWLRVRIDGPVLPFEEGGAPRHLSQLRSYFDLGEDLEFNAALYHVDRVPFTGAGAYTRLDLGLSWRATPALRLDLWGRNLLDAQHREASGAQVPRTVFALATFELTEHDAPDLPANVRGTRRRPLARALLLFALLLLPALASAQRPQPGELEIEAAYLVNFLRYTQWPASSFDGAGSPYVLTVVGSERVAASVRAVAAAAGSIDGRAIEVRWLPDARGSRAAPFDSPRDQQARAALRASHLVFFHQGAGRVHPQVLADLARTPVLTVSDTEGFSSAGGMLELVRSNRRILFQANAGAIRNASLLVSAKVLKLARPASRALQ